MPLKLIIVDDEYLIRQLIRNCVDWDRLNIEIVGEMMSAAEALRQIPYLEPDIILTDICMPVTDGLSFSENVKMQYPFMKIIAITGYDNFEYAKRGIHIGLDGYILKPIDVKELEEIIVKIRSKIEFENSRRSEMTALSALKKEAEYLIRKYYLDSLLESETSEEIVNSQFKKEFPIEESDFIWICVLDYSVGRLEISEKERKQRENWIVDYCEKKIEGVIWTIDKLGRLVVIDRWERIEHQDFIRKLACGWRGVYADMLYYGYDLIRNKEKSIHKAYLTAAMKLSIAIINGSNEYRRSSVNNEIGGRLEQLFSIKELGEMRCYIETGNIEKMCQMIEQWFEAWQGVSVDELMYLKIQFLNIIFYLYILFGKDYEMDMQSLYFRFYGRMEKVKQLVELKEEFIETCKAISRIFQEDTDTADISKLIYSMKQYIKENLDDPELSLVTLAKTYYLNSSYLSRVFKKEVKSSFVEYLIDQRMEKAKQLLLYTNLKSYEVGERVGIYNANYFGILFKKRVGVTPVEYRKQHEEK